MSFIVKAYKEFSEALRQYAQVGGVANPSATTMQMMQDLFMNWSDTMKMMVQNFWQPEKVYEVGEVIISPNMPKGFRAYVKTGGTTSNSEPQWSNEDGKEISDGSVTFVMKKIIYILPKVVSDLELQNKLLITYSDKTTKEIAIVKTINNNAPDDNGNVEVSAALVGDIFYRPYLAPNHVKANGATVNRADYPTLKNFADENNMWTTNPTNEPWKYGVGDGSKTMVLPDYRGRVIQGGDITAVLAAGLPEIQGLFNTCATSANADGCFSSDYSQQGDWRSSEKRYAQTITMRASKSNAIYSASDTVQPPALQMIPQIKY